MRVLVVEHLRIAESVAWEFRRFGPFDHLRSDAELGLVEAALYWDGRVPFVPWARTLCRQRVARGLKRSILPIDPTDPAHLWWVPGHEPSPVAAAMHAEDRERVQAALGRLQDGDRALVASWLDGASLRLMGDRLRIHHTTAGYRLNRALGRLREMLRDQGHTAPH